MKCKVDEKSTAFATCTPAVCDRVTALASFLDRANKPRGIDDLNAKKPDTGEDWPLFNLVFPYIKRVNKELAGKFLEAMKDPRITKRFYKPEKVEESFKTFISKDPKKLKGNPFYDKALRDIGDLLGKDKIKHLSLDNNLKIGQVFSNKDASAGSIMPGQTKVEAWDIIYAVALWYYDNLPQDDPYPAMPFSRAQISGYVNDNSELTPEKVKHKQRLVWCINAGMVLVEALYARPLMDEVLPRVTNYAGGKTPGYIRRKLRSWRHWYWVCLDYSAYDSTVPKWLIKDVFELIKAKFDESQHDVLDWICYHFIHTKIYMPDGSIKQKCKGIPSGSYFTQIVGTLINLVVIRTYMIKLKGKDDVDRFMTENGEYTFMAMGDDNILFTPFEINRKHLSKWLKEKFGLDVNSDKCDHGNPGTDPVFLKRAWQKDGEWRNPLELLINMCTPEYFRDYDGRGFRPAHVLYGYWLTYKNALKPFFKHKDIVKLIKAGGGAEKMLILPDRALPGSLYALKLTNPSLFKSLVREVMRDEAKLAVV